MRVFVYVDGFNVYYRALKGTPFKWLNPVTLSTRLLDVEDRIAKLRYFTARVGEQGGNVGAPRRQQIYLNALKSVPEVTVHYGRFLQKTKWRPMVTTGQFVEVRDSEEKGSDVNLAVHLLNDAWNGSFDVALVLSQDTDLVEPIRLVTQERKLVVGIVCLDGREPSKHLARVATFVRHTTQADLAASQFTDVVNLPNGRQAERPPEWTIER